MAKTVIECLTKLADAVDNDLLLCKVWDSNSQNPKIDYTIPINGDFAVAVRPESVGDLALYGPEGIKGQTSTGYAAMRTKVEANIARQVPEEDPPPKTSTLDELYDAIPTVA